MEYHAWLISIVALNLVVSFVPVGSSCRCFLHRERSDAMRHYCICRDRRRLNFTDGKECRHCSCRHHHIETALDDELNVNATEQENVENPIASAGDTGYIKESDLSTTESGHVEEPNVDLKVPFSCILWLGFVVLPSVVMQRLKSSEEQQDNQENFSTPPKDNSTQMQRIVPKPDESFRIKYGVVDEIGRYKMMLTCARKAKLAGKSDYGRTLLQGYKLYTGDKRRIGHMTYKELCRMVAANITAEEWMRFVRLHLNLDNDEIREARLKYCVITTEHVYQIRYWSERPAELDSVLKQGFKQVNSAKEYQDI